MKAIIDEAVPRRLVRVLRAAGCDVSAFPDEWKGLKNGDLLGRIEAAGISTLLTCDRNLSFQQSIHRRAIAVVVLPAQRMSDLLAFVAEIIQAIEIARPGTVLLVEPRTRQP